MNQKHLVTALILFALIGAAYGISRAQSPGQELLVNNGMDSYYGTGGGNVVPVGWTLTADGAVRSAKQDWVFNEFPGYGSSWEVTASSRTFTMIASQFVPAVRSGTKVRFSAYSNVFTCNQNTSCIDSKVGHRVSDTSSGARTRIGIDPNGGSDPNAASVIWAPYISPFDTFQQATIDSQSQNDNGVTLYLNATQSVGMLLNMVYWDNASLQVTGPGEPTQGPRIVPFVTPQGQQPDGSIIHIVKAGDTLASIAVAYKVTVQHIRELNNIPQDEYLLQIGQKLIIQKAPPPPITYIVVTATPTEDPNQTWTPTPTATVTATTAESGAPPTQPFVIITLAPPTATPLAGSFYVPPGGAGASNTSLVSNRSWQDVPVRLPISAPKPALLSAADSSVCVTAYDDRNANCYRDANESALAGVGLRLMQADREVQNLITTTGEPACFQSLASGTYTLLAVPPDTYGLTTANQVRIEINADARIDLSFGAAAGYKPTATPGAPGKAASRPVDEAPGWLITIWDNSGLIVLGAAGVVLIGGLIVAARNH